MTPRSPPLQSIRLLDQARERIRYMHYSQSTENTYLYWVRFYVRWAGRGGNMRHPSDMGVPEVEGFLSMLATERGVWGRGGALIALLRLLLSTCKRSARRPHKAGD